MTVAASDIAPVAGVAGEGRMIKPGVARKGSASRGEQRRGGAGRGKGKSADLIQWRSVDSSNVREIGWDRAEGMYVRFHGGTVYRYAGVSRQRVVACARASSVGRYVNLRVKPRFACTKIGGQE